MNTQDFEIDSSRYEEYESLLLERDQLLKEAGQIHTAYLQAFGELMQQVFEAKMACISSKKTIAYLQREKNTGGVVDVNAMQEFLAGEMAAYDLILSRMIRENRAAAEAETVSPYEVRRSKELYRRIAKFLHPDIFPMTDREDALREIWARVCQAYNRHDVKQLAELEVVARKALKDLGLEMLPAQVWDIDGKIEALLDEIWQITHEEPYLYDAVLSDEEASAKKTKELQEELAGYRKYQEELAQVVAQMLAEGGLSLQWENPS